MKLLAVDTATEQCGAAIAVDGRVTAELCLDLGRTHTRTIMAAIRSLLSVAGLTVSDMDLFAVTRGPGSFTGLRIGISTVKGLAVATGKPMVGVSSLDVIARQAAGEAPLVCALIDARRSEVYWRLYRRDGNAVAARSDERVGRARDIAPHIDDTCHFIGNGLARYRGDIEAALKHPAEFSDNDGNGIRPSAVARLAWSRYQSGQVDDAVSFAPVYLRQSDAELNRER